MRTRTATRPGTRACGWSRSIVLAAAGLLVLLAISGCAPDGTAAVDTAQKFSQALAASDWSGACAMLLADAREKVAKDRTCEENLQALQIPEPGTVTRTGIYGRSALIEFENDAVFLTVAEGGWKITAAGCTPNGAKPYTCEVGGD
jgi:hypothetical protein